MHYFNTLTFLEEPNYMLLKQMIQQTAVDGGIDLFDNVFDWSEKLAN